MNKRKTGTRRVKRANPAGPTAAECNEQTPKAAERTKHTAGPWHAFIDDVVYVAPPDGDAPVICDLLPRDADVFTEEDEANAHLIAAAPELLMKLKEMLHGMACSCRLQHFVGGAVPCGTCLVSALVRKAEGWS